MTEKSLLNDLLLRASELGARLFRQNVGQGWTGEVIRTSHLAGVTARLMPGDVLIRRARPFHAGLCVGSSDLIGWTPTVITADMVGETVAVFTAIEAKTGKLRASKEQQAFISAVDKSGGFAGVARALDDLASTIKKDPA